MPFHLPLFMVYSDLSISIRPRFLFSILETLVVAQEDTVSKANAITIIPMMWLVLNLFMACSFRLKFRLKTGLTCLYEINSTGLWVIQLHFFNLVQMKSEKEFLVSVLENIYYICIPEKQG